MQRIDILIIRNCTEGSGQGALESAGNDQIGEQTGSHHYSLHIPKRQVEGWSSKHNVPHLDYCLCEAEPHRYFIVHQSNFCGWDGVQVRRERALTLVFEVVANGNPVGSIN